MKRRKGDYHRLKGKMFRRIVLMVLLAILFVLLVRNLLRGYLGNLIVELMMALFDVSYESALETYDVLIRNHINWILTASAAILGLIFIRVFITRTTGYFDLISAGIRQLAQRDAKPIELPQELESVENQLNQIKLELEARTREASEAEQKKDDLVMYLAHDIRTPLTSVIGYLNLLDESGDMPAAYRKKYTDVALEKAYRLEELIDELFEITRFNLQSIPLERKQFDLVLLLSQVADEFYPAAKAQRKVLRLYAPDSLILFGDADKLARVFNNILKNALAYSYPDSVVSIRASLEEEAVVTISNTGDTIPEEKLEIIFEKFYRLDQARSSRAGGAGLGLAIAREIVVAHNGRISAQSKDNCTEFTVSLPLSGVRAVNDTRAGLPPAPEKADDAVSEQAEETDGAESKQRRKRSAHGKV